MKLPDDLTTENIIAIGTALATTFALFNEKIRSFLLRKLSFLKSKSEITRDANAAMDSTIETMLNRINILSTEFVKLSESNSVTQKENFKLKSQVTALEYELKVIKDTINIKCKNNCFDVPDR